MSIIFRCHSLGELMGAKGLGVTGRKRAIKTYIENTDNRYKEIKSKYLEKGIMNETNAITLCNEVLGAQFTKNDERLTNEFITGECDIKEPSEIADVKCSWDRFTFEESRLADDYEWQLRGYMELYDKPKSRVIYCLTDCPDNLILSILKSASFQYDGDLPDEIAIRMVINMIFDVDNFHQFLEMAPIDRRVVKKQIDSFVHIPKERRIHQVEFTRDETKTKLLYSRINEARTFIKSIYESQTI